jgi:hypothetical protein
MRQVDFSHVLSIQPIQPAQHLGFVLTGILASKVAQSKGQETTKLTLIQSLGYKRYGGSQWPRQTS